MKMPNITKKYGIFIVFIIIVAIFGIVADNFFTISNMFNILRQISMIGIVSVGMMFVMLTGGIDLSVGSQIAFINVMCSYMIVNMEFNAFLSCIICIVICGVIGVFNGICVTKVKMPPIIVTLATMTIFSGLAFIISSGQPISGFPDGFTILGQGYVWIIPIPVICFVLVAVVGAVILNKTYFGKYFYAVGGNEEAAELSGINVHKIKTLSYTLCGILAGLAGLIMLSRLNTGSPNTGTGYEFEAITAVVLGGVSVSGGRGKMSGLIAGVLIMGVLANGFILLNINEYMQDVVQGIVLLVAVGFDCMSRASESKIVEKKKAKDKKKQQGQPISQV